MGQKICMNASCATTTTVEWKKGWPLRTGGFADLCFRCGSAYESSLFCDTFHKEQSGWRECYMCHKLLHCGCIASKLMVDLLDFGGIGCTSCTNCCHNSSLTERSKNQGLLGRLTMMVADRQTLNGESGVLGNDNDSEANEPSLFPQPQSGTQRGDPQMIHGGDKRDEFMTQPGSTVSVMDTGDMQEPLSQPSLSMSLAVTPSGPSSFPSGFVEGKMHILNHSTIVMKPSPAEGRGRNLLLSRYCPRITDQELQQISGNLNSKIVPLFEKILSASDAGRIGRLVLPKACAEAYFPSIDQPEGTCMKIQDVKGKEWTFQFRFWPNNNSRMYVLEGVTPCMQSMKLKAGDTVTFSRIDPGGKLVMGCRKTASGREQQGSGLKHTSWSGVTEIPSSMNCSSCPLQMPEEVEGLPEHMIILQKRESNGRGIADDESSRIKEEKWTRNIGTKNKRLLLLNEEAMELRLTWEEAQDLLCPPPTANPTIVTVEEHRFEEYDEPPVFGKKTVFTSRPSGGHEQWAQCDNCSKWRRLPVDALLPSRWTCSYNVWDVGRCLCSAAEENLNELDSFLRLGTESKKQRTGESWKEGTEQEEGSGMDEVAGGVVKGDSSGENGDGPEEEEEVAATTRHPRHRPGCSCIVCIQPPSGRGRHEPGCSCNVCVAVKRRFRTLMLRKRKKQLEREGGAEENHDINDNNGETVGIDLNSDPYNNRGEEMLL
ncbi:PREDICTED: B3 domain-containing transcription repressor VAL1-like [Tarenaya hassleriana]|uniref:B3 domain-containing transcription repressor VAL1-like n=1 Tax=Tarenaya hassleriana TaxID=28532 RepID=UPI00053C336A|nr:PREDICTED: B3 domain-containing transcription repressor VAL1-like [Tarenaya hassleriana]